jgi:hypothetical protein
MTSPVTLSLADQVKAKQTRLADVLAEAAALERELNTAFQLLSPSSGRPRPALVARPIVAAPVAQVTPKQETTTEAVDAPAAPSRRTFRRPDGPTIERLVRFALMTGPLASSADAYDLRTLEERCEDIPGLTGGTVERVLNGLLQRRLVKRERRLYRRAA